MPTRTIHLATTSATYPIVIGSGLLRTLFPRLRKLMAGRPFRPFLITSPNIWKLHAGQVLASFPPAQEPAVLFLPPGERHKRLAAVESLAGQLARHRADRDTLLLAFGGGVIGDITGFLAAIYMRGIPYVQLPTTLLAQVDSSVGGKTGVNLAAGKNLLGSFHHPRAVFADLDTLTTLPNRELRAGLQESIKAGIIGNPNLFSYLERHLKQILAGDPAPLATVIAASVKVKAEVVAQDEKEAGLRMILNFGHTLGHAVEAATGYRQLLHGEAVAWGSIAALRLGLGRGTVTPAQFARMANLILVCGPLPRFRATPARLVALTATDKKSRSGRRTFILPRGIGKVEIVHDVTGAELLKAATSMFDDMKVSTASSPRPSA